MKEERLLTETGRRIVTIAIVAGIAYYLVGPVGVAVVALVLLCKKSKDISKKEP